MPSEVVMRLLRQGFAAQQSGQDALAESCYQKALQHQPDEPDALQLLGLLAKKRGDLSTTEQYLRRSLAARPSQPHVWNNLANVVWRQGRSDEALVCWQQALSMTPDDPDANFNLARALHELQRAGEASAALARAMRAANRPTVGMLQLQATLASDAGRLNDALAALEQGLALDPQRGALHHNHAVLLHRLQRHEAAWQAHERARACGLDEADAHYNRGNTLQALGRLRDAVDCYRDALVRQPTHPLALHDLARLRWRLGDYDFDAELRAALRHDPADAQPALQLGHLLWRAQAFDLSAEAYAVAVRRGGGAMAHDGLGRCRVRQGRAAEGLAQHERAVALLPTVAALHANRAASCLVAGQGEQARRSALMALELDPDNQHALALLGLAWRLQGDPREQRLVDPDRFVAVVDLPAPAGWTTMEAFLADLSGELDCLHLDRCAPIDQTLRLGTQTLGDLLVQKTPAARTLRTALSAAIDVHLAALPEEADHPFLGRRGRGWTFGGSWSARLSEAGHHVDHVHPQGWISAAFYVQVPRCCDDPVQRAGWLRFGRPDGELGPVPGLTGPPLRLVQPRPGRLVLFPSMLWHGTVPIQGGEVRTTVSFDILPSGSAAARMPAWLQD